MEDKDRIGLVGLAVMILIVGLYLLIDWNYNYPLVFWSTVFMGLSVYGVSYLTIKAQEGLK